MICLDLCGTWELCESMPSDENPSEPLGGWNTLEAAVPGDVNSALQQSGRLPDPHYDVNAREYYFVTGREWWYRRHFSFSGSGKEARLCFENADGTAEVFLNGRFAGRMENAFREHVFPVKGLLRDGENEIAVRFLSVDSLIGKRSHELAGWKERRTLLRKPQYNFGWDWALPVPSLGLAGSVRLETDYEYEFTDYSVRTFMSGRVDFQAEVSEAARQAGYSIEVRLWGHGEFLTRCYTRGTRRSYTHVQLQSPRLWFPAGYGDPALYRYRISLTVGAVERDVISGQVGIREAEILEEPFSEDAGDGYSFWLLINKKRVFCRGSNWIPTQLWPGAADDSDYDFYLSRAAAANFNILRVWGGGIYEKNRFYDLCDQYGIMVWQDFMFASAGYPVDVLQEEIIKEADYQLRRLRNHTCLVLWCGCNEDVYSWAFNSNRLSAQEKRNPTENQLDRPSAGTQTDSGVYAVSAQETTGTDRLKWDPVLYSMILRGLTGRFGNGVPFIESSPQSRDDIGNMPNSGNCHISAWKYALFETNRQYGDWRKHFDRVSSFNSEFCIQGPCSEKMIRSFFRPENCWPPNDAWIYHIQRGHAMLPHFRQTMEIAGSTFGEISSLQDYVKYGQATHLEMMRAEFDAARADYPNCGGTMSWMFNDCWPTSNWSMIDYSKDPKPCYYAAARACAPVSPIVFLRSGRIRFLISNQTFRSCRFRAVWGGEKFDSSRVFQKSSEGLVGENEAVLLDSLPVTEIGLSDYCFLDLVFDGTALPRTIFFPGGWRDVRFPAPFWKLDFEEFHPVRNGYQGKIRVRAETFLRLFHFVYSDDSNRPVYSDNFFDLTKGDEKELTVTFRKKPDLSLLQAGSWDTRWK